MSRVSSETSQTKSAVDALSHERHQLMWHHDERSHHVVVFVLQDVAVVHVSAGEGFEAHENIDDFVGIDPNSVLEAELILIEAVRDTVVGLLADPHCRAGFGVGDAAIRYLDSGGLPAEDLKGVEMHVDRMGIAGQVDETPDLRAAQHREEIGLVLESGGDRAPAADLTRLAGSRFDKCYHWFVGRPVLGELPHRQRGGLTLPIALLLNECDRAHNTTVQIAPVGPLEVGGKHRWRPAATATSIDDAKQEHLRIR